MPGHASLAEGLSLDTLIRRLPSQVFTKLSAFLDYGNLWERLAVEVPANLADIESNNCQLRYIICLVLFFFFFFVKVMYLWCTFVTAFRFRCSQSFIQRFCAVFRYSIPNLSFRDLYCFQMISVLHSEICAVFRYFQSSIQRFVLFSDMLNRPFRDFLLFSDILNRPFRDLCCFQIFSFIHSVVCPAGQQSRSTEQPDCAVAAELGNSGKDSSE